MATSIFAQTITRAISEYRQMLRRHLAQAERVKKLAELKLKDTALYESDLRLYEAAWNIVKDIEANMQVEAEGYYSYSGISLFCEYLKEYLENYEVEGNSVVHRAQKASKSLITAIQIGMLPENRLNDEIKQKLLDCNKIIAQFGSDEQREMYLSNIERQQSIFADFYDPILNDFQLLVGEAEAA